MLAARGPRRDELNGPSQSGIDCLDAICQRRELRLTNADEKPMCAMQQATSASRICDFAIPAKPDTGSADWEDSSHQEYHGTLFSEQIHAVKKSMT